MRNIILLVLMCLLFTQSLLADSIVLESGKGITISSPSSDPRKWQRAIERYSSIHIQLDESPTLEVNNSTDIAVLDEVTMSLCVELMFGCMAEITRELSISGMDEEGIGNFLDEKEMEMQKACLCENRSVVSGLFKKMDSILIGEVKNY